MELVLMLVIVFLLGVIGSVRKSWQDAHGRRDYCKDTASILPAIRKDWRHRGKPLIVRSQPFASGVIVIPKMLSKCEFEVVKKNLIKQYRQEKPLVFRNNGQKRFS